jgi:hypothetical protein
MRQQIKITSFILLSKDVLDKLYKTANGTRQANLSTETMSLPYYYSNMKQQHVMFKS